MLKKLTRKRLHGLEERKVKHYIPLPPIDGCVYGCVSRCDPGLPLEDSCYCNGEVCLLI